MGSALRRLTRLLTGLQDGPDLVEEAGEKVGSWLSLVVRQNAVVSEGEFYDWQTGGGGGDLMRLAKAFESAGVRWCGGALSVGWQ